MGATTSPRPADAGSRVTAALPTLADVLVEHGLAGVAEEEMRHDGWSGAGITRMTRGDGARFVLKRDSLRRDWLARVTRDVADLREALLVRARPALPAPVQLPHLGVARDGDETVLLMPDLTGTLLTWEAVADVPTVDRVLAALARLHAEPWHEELPATFPWTGLRTRVLMLTRPAAGRYEAEGLPVGERFRLGWDAFDRHASSAARDLVRRLAADADPLLAALASLPHVGLHGDFKFGNAGLVANGTVYMIDWQLTLVAPIAVELGWLLVCNVASIPLSPVETLERYRRIAGLPDDARWAAERDLAIIVGLLLRGWRKGYDADAGLTLPNGWSASDDLAWWGTAAVDAAARWL
jgi:hypothetical protein